MGHPGAQFDVVTGKKRKEERRTTVGERIKRMKDGDGDLLAAWGSTALAARMKDEWHCYHVNTIAYAAARRGCWPCSSLGGFFSRYFFLG